MHSKKSTYSLSFFLLYLLLPFPITTQAFPKTDIDFLQLPPYCAARSGRASQASIDHWQSIIGRKDWIHIHHYCSLLHDINKSYTLPKEGRNEILVEFIKNPTYMEKMGTSHFIFLPELYTLRGESLVRLGRKEESIAHFQKAIETNPNFTRSYRQLSKLYENQGKHQEAIAIIKQGLKHRPNSKGLNYALKNLTK